jgi:P-type conjugative transfer protein TrbJ
MAATAEGRMQALQYANQLATLQAKQLMDVRALLIQAQIAEATRNQTLANDEAMRQAADAKFFGGTLQNKAANGYKP